MTHSANKFDILDEVKQFLERNKLQKCKKEQIPRKPTSIKETESVSNNFPKQKTLGSEDLTGGFYATFKKELIPIFHNFLQIN